MLEVSNVRLPLDAGLEGDAARALVRDAAARALGVSAGRVSAVRVMKRSVDARKKCDVHFVATLGVELADAALEERVLANPQALQPGVSARHHIPCEPLRIPSISAGQGGDFRPVVVGTGPAGLFCALYLARAGLRPLVLERGGGVDERIAAVRAFNAGADLDPKTNIQFGAGGAGTFSDGKLTTGTKSPLARHVLQWFVEAGAPEEILWRAKPHIGTDRLVEVVRTLCRQIEEAGGEVRLHAQVTGFRFDELGKLCALEVCGDDAAQRKGIVDCGMDVDRASSVARQPLETEPSRFARTGEPLPAPTSCAEIVPARQVVLACGHSARDTFAALFDAGVVLEQKPFSVGVRIEHRQAQVNRSQYGEAGRHPALGAADYKLAVHLPAVGKAGADPTAGRGVYTFCMCPGGEVVCAASEEGGVVVNGMSRFVRDGENANSALLVDVRPQDFGSTHPLAGVEFARRIERAAYSAAIAAGGKPYQAPAQTVGDFLAHRAGAPSRTVRPTYARGVAWCDLHECLPSFVCESLERALPLLERKLAGFSDVQAVMTGVETRSSSPVRIVRDESLQARVGAGAFGAAPGEAPVPSGLYPCGEGAGYAGGIMSAACDGLRVAQALIDATAR